MSKSELYTNQMVLFKIIGKEYYQYLENLLGNIENIRN